MSVTSPELPPNLADLPELITVEEFCAVARLSRTTGYDLVRSNQIPGVLRFGRTIRIPREAVNSFTVSQVK